MAKKETNLTLGISEPEKVDVFMQGLNHPMKDVVTYVRSLILSVDTNIGEGIYWNAPTFFYTGAMQPFDAKEYKRYIVGFVFNRTDCIRLVFLRGALVADYFKLLEGDFKDQRKLIVFKSLDDVKEKEIEFKQIISSLVSLML